MSTYPENVPRPEPAPAGEGRAGTLYRVERIGRLGPRQIRGVRFRVTRFGRRGVDPEVRRFLARIAAEVIELYAELAEARDESNHLRVVLREWQTRYGAGNGRRARYERPSQSGIVPNQSRRYDGA